MQLCSLSLTSFRDFITRKAGASQTEDWEKNKYCCSGHQAHVNHVVDVVDRHNRIHRRRIDSKKLWSGRTPQGKKNESVAIRHPHLSTGRSSGSHNAKALRRDAGWARNATSHGERFVRSWWLVFGAAARTVERSFIPERLFCRGRSEQTKQ